MSGDRSGAAQRALLRALARTCGAFTVVAEDSRDWASATFDGARHRLTLRLEGDMADLRARTAARGLPEADLPLRGGFVADLIASASGPDLAIEALTIEAA